jgi:3-deoxy-D-manno-octulosonic-acid transferase
MLGLTLWRLIYGMLLAVARPWVRLRLKLRARAEPAYGARVAERFGAVPESVPVAPIWFHTVSAGETIAAAPLIARLASRDPGTPILVTTMTPTGSAQVERLLGGTVAHCYAPYDFPDVVHGFFERVRPRLLVLMETELWPNMLRAAAVRNVPALLINARLSERSARGYRWIAPLTREMLTSLARIACQYPDHARRFRALGAQDEQLLITGSVKFDITLPDDHAARVTTLHAVLGLAGRPVWIAASTHDGEEGAVLSAHRAIRDQHPGALLILVPRHPSRATQVAGLVAEAGLSCAHLSALPSSRAEEQATEANARVTARTQPVAPQDVHRPAHGDRPERLDGVDVLLGDTMGELLYLYGLSAVAFIGGTLVSVGGHNPIEAAVCGQPLVMGPHTHNFEDVVASFTAGDCLTRVTGGAELGRAVAGWLADPAARAAAGERAMQVVRANQGATERLLDLLGGWAAADRESAPEPRSVGG